MTIILFLLNLYQPIFDFTVVNNSFEMAPPKVDDPENQRLVDKGLEGKV